MSANAKAPSAALIVIAEAKRHDANEDGTTNTLTIDQRPI
jgi:hypothetical protein